MPRFCGRAGSSAKCTLPASFSYGPAAPNGRPLRTTSRRSICSLVTPASATAGTHVPITATISRDLITARLYGAPFPLTVESNLPYASFVYRKEAYGQGPRRPAARHARHAGAESAAAAADARLGHHRTHRAVVRKRAATRTRHAVSRTVSARTPGVDRLGVAHHPKQPARALLRVDQDRPQAFCRRAGAMAPHVARGQPRARRHARR